MKANKKMAVGLSVLMAASVMNIATIPALAEDDDKVITFWNHSFYRRFCCRLFSYI